MAERKIAIVGAGGHARETSLLLVQCGIARERIAGFFVDDRYWSDTLVEGFPQFRMRDFDPASFDAVVAIGDSALRRAMIAAMPAETCYPGLVHPSAITPPGFKAGEGVIVHAGCIITTNVTLNRHVQLNRGTQIGHDSVLGEFSTTAPGAIVSGNCTIGMTSYLGAMSCIRERQRVGDNATVGMGSVVVSDVPDHATYVGNPARPLVRTSK